MIRFDLVKTYEASLNPKRNRQPTSVALVIWSNVSKSAFAV